MIRVFTSKTQKIGEYGESAAVAWLKKQGFTISDRNSANPYGEIDIVAKKGTTTYFFEVKTGKYGSSILPIENFTKTKLQKCFISAQYYSKKHHITDYRIEGLVVVIKGDTVISIEQIALY